MISRNGSPDFSLCRCYDRSLVFSLKSCTSSFSLHLQCGDQHCIQRRLCFLLLMLDFVVFGTIPAMLLCLKKISLSGWDWCFCPSFQMERFVIGRKKTHKQKHFEHLFMLDKVLIITTWVVHLRFWIIWDLGYNKQQKNPKACTHVAQIISDA